MRQDVVEGTCERTAQLVAPWGEGTGKLYAGLAKAVAQEQPVSDLAAQATADGVHEVVGDAVREAAKTRCRRCHQSFFARRAKWRSTLAHLAPCA